VSVSGDWCWIGLDIEWYERAYAYNLQFSAPLDENEVNGIAKSIAKWTSKNFTSSSFEEFITKTHSPEIQSKRGRVGGLISKGGGRKSLGEPWLALGVSRRTYFRIKSKNKD